MRSTTPTFWLSVSKAHAERPRQPMSSQTDGKRAPHPSEKNPTPSNIFLARSSADLPQSTRGRFKPPR